MAFLSSLLSKKLGALVAVEGLIQTLPATADTKTMATSAVGVAYLIGQALVDAYGPKPQL